MNNWYILWTFLEVYYGRKYSFTNKSSAFILQWKLTEQEISARLGISRPKVSRLLKKALEIGIVEIKINTNNDLTSMEKEIEKKYKLQEVKIVEYKTEENELLKKNWAKQQQNY